MSNTIKQLSVFMENREGRLDDVLQIMAEGGINIVALSLAENSDYGIMRMIVSDPYQAKDILKENDMTAMLTDVVAIRVPHAPGSLSKAIHALVGSGANIEYMYAFANGSDASAVLKTDDADQVVQILKDNGYDVYREDEAYTVNQ